MKALKKADQLNKDNISFAKGILIISIVIVAIIVLSSLL